MLVLLVRGSLFASSLLLIFLLSCVTLLTSFSELAVFLTLALPAGTLLGASLPLPAELSFGDFTALEVLIGGGGAPGFLLIPEDLGTAPLLSTLLGGVGAEDDGEENDCGECPEPSLDVPDPVTLESRDDALASVCGGLSS